MIHNELAPGTAPRGRANGNAVSKNIIWRGIRLAILATHYEPVVQISAVHLGCFVPVVVCYASFTGIVAMNKITGGRAATTRENSVFESFV